MKKRKNVFVTAMLSLIIISTQCLGQSTTGNNLVKPDSRINACFGNEAVAKMQNESPDLLKYYNYYLSNSFFIVPLDAPKPITGIDIHTVKVKSDYSGGKSISFKENNIKKPAEAINPMLFDFKEKYDEYVTYIWKEAGVAVVFLPRKLFISNYNNIKKTL